MIYHKLPYFSLNLGKNLGKTWESIFSQESPENVYFRNPQAA